MAMMLHATIYFSLCVSGVCEVVVNATLSLVGATLPHAQNSTVMGFRVTMEVQG